MKIGDLKFKNNIIIGAYFILIGFLLFIKVLFDETTSSIILSSILFSVVGINLIVKSLLGKQKHRKFFLVGVNILFLSVCVFVSFLTDYKLIEKFWPIVPLFLGCSFVFYDLVITRNNSSVFISGLFIMVISLGVFSVTLGANWSFKRFMLILITSSIIFIGICLVKVSNNNDERD